MKSSSVNNSGNLNGQCNEPWLNLNLDYRLMMETSKDATFTGIRRTIVWSWVV
jgi:hypothetical protein